MVVHCLGWCHLMTPVVNAFLETNWYFQSDVVKFYHPYVCGN